MERLIGVTLFALFRRLRLCFVLVAAMEGSRKEERDRTAGQSFDTRVMMFENLMSTEFGMYGMPSWNDHEWRTAARVRRFAELNEPRHHQSDSDGKLELSDRVANTGPPRTLYGSLYREARVHRNFGRTYLYIN